MPPLVTVQEVVDRVDAWRGRSVETAMIKGGLSHETYLATVDGGERYVVRLLNPQVEQALLGISPGDEIENTIRAAATGVGPAVIQSYPDMPALVLEFLDGEVMSVPALQQPERIRRAGIACRRLHDRSAPFVTELDIFRHRERFLALCDREGIRIPDGYRDYDDHVRRIEAAITAQGVDLAPCHNDLLAENLIEVGDDLRIIDFQLSGTDHRAFELGDLAAESDYDPDMVERLVEAYYGERLPGRVAETRLCLAMSNTTWCLWMCIYIALVVNETVEFDYWSEAMDKWGQALRDLEGPDFGRLLDEARTGAR
jgi:thiamine kinase-like enzyme